MEFAKTVFGLRHPEGYSSKRVRGNFSGVPHCRSLTGGMFGDGDSCLLIILKHAPISICIALVMCCKIKYHGRTPVSAPSENG